MALNKLFMQRFARNQRTNLKYLRLLFNDHFIVFLMIAIGGLLLAYRQLFVTQQSDEFWHQLWWPLFNTLWLVIGLNMGHLVTYFKPADRLFLLGSDQLIIKKYLNYSVILSCGYAFLWQIIFMATIIPIFWQIYNGDMTRLALLAGFIMTYKWLSLLGERDSLLIKTRQSFNSWLMTHPMMNISIFRFSIPVIMIAMILLLSIQWLLVLTVSWLLVAAIMAKMLFISQEMVTKIGIDWHKANLQAQKHEQRVLHFYAMFANVPHQPKTIKRRRYLDYVVFKLAKHRSVMYRLYITRLARDVEILPLVLRLIAVGAIMVYALQAAPSWLIAIVGALTVYLVVFQMLPLYDETQKNMWTRLLPIDTKAKQKAFRLLSGQLMALATIIMIIASITHGLQAVGMTIISLAVIIVFLNNIYIPRQFSNKKSNQK